MSDGSVKEVSIFEVVVELLLEFLEGALNENVLGYEGKKRGMLREIEREGEKGLNKMHTFMDYLHKYTQYNSLVPHHDTGL